MKKIILLVLSLVFVVSLISQINAIYTQDNLTIANMGHAIRVQEIGTFPSEIAPGGSGVLSIKLVNNAKFYMDDLVLELNLPTGIRVLNDVNKVKISRLNPLEPATASFNIIVSPDVSEGVYSSSMLMSYVSYLGTNYANVGEEKEDNNTFSIIVKGTPEIFASIEKTEIYEGNYLGSVTVNLVNSGIGDAKLLSLELLESANYEIISTGKRYIGDLNTDDFDSADFRIKLNNKKTPELLLRISYKNALNEDSSKEVKLPLEIKSAEELGISSNNTSKIIGVIILIGVIFYFVYNYRKNKNKFMKKYQ